MGLWFHWFGDYIVLEGRDEGKQEGKFNHFFKGAENTKNPAVCLRFSNISKMQLTEV
jgi:hypothetical protein